jgi:hypothetical protein
MTKHMVRLYVEPPKGDAENAIDDWVQNHNEWTDGPQTHTFEETNTEVDGSGTQYVLGVYRFYQDTPETDLLDRLEDRLSSLQGGLWYRIGYHVCDHDEDQENKAGCDWTAPNSDIRESTGVPSDIPTFT